MLITIFVNTWNALHRYASGTAKFACKDVYQSRMNQEPRMTSEISIRQRQQPRQFTEPLGGTHQTSFSASALITVKIELQMHNVEQQPDKISHSSADNYFFGMYDTTLLMY